MASESEEYEYAYSDEDTDVEDEYEEEEEAMEWSTSADNPNAAPVGKPAILLWTSENLQRYVPHSQHIIHSSFFSP